VNVESTSFIKQTVNLPKDAESITLTFYYNTRRDSERDSGDVQFVEIFNNLTGTFLTRVLTEQSDTRDWVVRQRDLMPYSGQQISVYFVVENDGGKNSVAMNIDDVSIVACKPVVPPTETPTATNVPTLTAVPTVVVVPTSRDTSVATLTPVPTIIPAVTSALPIGGSNECQNYLINGDFETGAANFGHPNFGYSTGWQRGRDPIPAELSSTEKYGGNYAVLLGHSPDNRHGDRQTYSSIRQLVTVPQYVASMELRWRHRSNSQEAVDNQPHRSNDRADVIFLDQNLKPIEVIHRQRDNSNTWKIATVPINTAKYSGRSFYVYFKPAFTKEPTQTFVGPLKPQNNVAPVQNTSESADDASTLRSTEAEPIPEYSITPIQPAKGLQEPTTLPSYATEPESSLLDTLGLGGSDDPQPISRARHF